jgi:putative nucleotidyltransferase with HDIG domain
MSTTQVEATAEAQTNFERFWQSLRLVLLSLLFVAGTAFVLLFPQLNSKRPYALELGAVALEDIRAPNDISYVSQIETEAAREAAAAAIADIYDPPDPRIGRQQVRRARQIMDFMVDVRADPFADTELKQRYLTAITALTLAPEEMTSLLDVSDGQFEMVEGEAVSLIEESMSGTVKEGNVEEVTSRLELKVSPDMPEQLIPLTVAIARNLIVPNSVLNVSATEQARAEAVENVPAIRHTFRQGEIVLRAGERVDELDLETLQVLGLAAQQLTWQDVASAILISLLSGALLSVYLVVFEESWSEHVSRLLLIVVLLLAFLTAAQIMIPNQGAVGYLYPAAALIMALTTLVSTEFAVLVTVVLALLVGYLSNGSLEMTTFVTVTSLFAAGSLRRPTRLNAYFMAGLASAIGGLAVLLVFQLPITIEPASLAQLLLLAMVNGLLSAGLALMLLFVVGNLTGITTSLRLLDLLRPDHPLQRRLQQEALGTYQHTLSVANLVEAAAEAIGADSLLARVGTLYHDVGKTQNPGFFIENRSEGGVDPHKGLSPLASARIIKAHVTDGLELARRYRLPPQIVDFIAEHHGTMPIAYFLHEAREEAEAAGVELNEEPFYYDGPIPQSRETAILMLADGCESATRANRPVTGEEIEELVTRIIQQRLDANQLDESGLTLTDIKTIKESIVRTLRGMYHPRVKYPGDKKPGKLPASDETRTLPPGATSDVSMPSEAPGSPGLSPDSDLVVEVGEAAESPVGDDAEGARAGGDR